jgi:hypothetical protein
MLAGAAGVRGVSVLLNLVTVSGAVTKVPRGVVPSLGVADLVDGCIIGGGGEVVLDEGRKMLVDEGRLLVLRRCRFVRVGRWCALALGSSSSNHSHNIFLNRRHGAFEASLTGGNNLVLLEGRGIHEILADEDETIVELVNLDAHPLSPRFGLFDAILNSSGMLDPFRIEQLTFASGCQNKQMIDLGVDGGDVEFVIGRIKFKDVLKRYHRNLQGGYYSKGSQLLEQGRSIIFGDRQVPSSVQDGDGTFEALVESAGVLHGVRVDASYVSCRDVSIRNGMVVCDEMVAGDS